MRENCTSGTVWGVLGNRHSYHDEASEYWVQKKTASLKTRNVTESKHILLPRHLINPGDLKC
jgi:hypothetical protein